jgi:peroxiredoxin
VFLACGLGVQQVRVVVHAKRRRKLLQHPRFVCGHFQWNCAFLSPLCEQLVESASHLFLVSYFLLTPVFLAVKLTPGSGAFAIGDLITNFKADSNAGPIDLFAYLNGQWGVIVSYPNETTELCMSELAESQLCAPSVKLLSLTCADSSGTKALITETEAVYNTSVTTPVISDPSRAIAREWGMLSTQEVLYCAGGGGAHAAHTPSQTRTHTHFRTHAPFHSRQLSLSPHSLSSLSLLTLSPHSLSSLSLHSHRTDSPPPTAPSSSLVPTCV